MDDGVYQSTVIFNGSTEAQLKEKIEQHCERYPVMYYETLIEPADYTFEDMED